MAILRRGTYSVEGRGWQVSNPVLDTRSDSECNVVTFIGETRVSVISLDMKAGNLYFNGKHTGEYTQHKSRGNNEHIH